MDKQAVKLKPEMYAHEQSLKIADVLQVLRETLGTYEFDRNSTVKFLEGYLNALKRIVHQADI